MMRMLLTALLIMVGASAGAEELVDVQGRYRVEPESVIRFSVAQLGGDAIAGQFTAFEGSFDLKSKDISKSKVTFSLKPEGVRAADPRVEEFIRSEAVFDVARYPTVTFVSDKIARTGDNTASISGKLTAKGRTNRTTLAVTFQGRKGRQLTFHVTGKMSRALFDMDVGVPVFSNVVVLDMELVGRKF